MLKRILAGTAVAAMGLAPFASQAAVTEVRNYVVGAAGEIKTICDAAAGVVEGIHVGGGCFNVTGASSVDVSIEDVSGQDVGFMLDWQGPSGRVAPLGIGCSGGGYAVPSGATSLVVRTQGVLTGPVSCPGAGIGIAGTITATMNAPDVS